MKNATELNAYLRGIQNKVINDMVKVQQETAKQVCNDAKELAPGNGKYSNSIKVNPTEIKDNEISTSITTDVTVTAKSNGNTYNLGFLLENGTLHHAIPNAFNWGVIYGFDSEMYKRTLDPNWHPGFAELPHFLPALDNNKGTYSENISKALDKEFK